MSPVTHVAEVAVNREFKNGVNSLDFEDIGRESKRAPKRIIKTKTVAII